jgi:transcriptional regulator with XRE-family HTH domain
MTNRPDLVLSEFIDAWNAGRRPRVRDYLARVPEGPERDALASELDTWLQTAPAPALPPEARAEIRAEPAVQHVLAALEGEAGTWQQTMPRLRARAGLSIAELARRIVERFGLGAGSEPRAAAYLQRMECGELEPSRVSRRLLDALGEALGASGPTLLDAGMLGRGLRPAGAGGTLFRADADVDQWIAEDIDVLSRAAMAPAPVPLDELDRLFVGGPDG